MRYLRENMNPIAQIILLLILYNIKPNMHCSSAPIDTVHLAYCILKNKQVDVFIIIPTKIKLVAESGRQPGAKENCPLVFPTLIMAICAHVQMNIIHVTITGNIDDLYLSRHCVSKKKKSVGDASSSGSSGNMNFQDWDSRQKVMCNYTWDVLEEN